MQEEKFVCWHCISSTNENDLSNYVKENGFTRNLCSYCHTTKKKIEYRVLIEQIRECLEDRFEDANEGLEEGFFIGNDEYSDIIEDNYPSYSFDEILAEDGISIDNNKLLNDLIDEFGYDWYETKHGVATEEIWLSSYYHEFCNKIKTERRFFTNSDSEYSILTDIADYIYDNKKSLIKIIKNKKIFYRARSITCAEILNAKSLGTPANNIFTINRMNPVGINYFYAADDVDTCIKELADNKDVIIAGFKSNKPLRILDLTKINEIPVPSIFSPIKSKAEILFLKDFATEISKEINEDDMNKKHLCYLPTQAFTEYIRFAFCNKYRKESIQKMKDNIPTLPVLNTCDVDNLDVSDLIGNYDINEIQTTYQIPKLLDKQEELNKNLDDFEPLDGIAYKSSKCSGTCYAFFFSNHEMFDKKEANTKGLYLVKYFSLNDKK